MRGGRGRGVRGGGGGGVRGGKRSERSQTASLPPTSVPQALVRAAETGGGQETLSL